MILVVGTKHSGGLFLVPTLECVGFKPMGWKRARSLERVPSRAIVRTPVSAVARFGSRKDPVIGLVRNWRAYSAIETEEGRPEIPPEITWWFQNFGMMEALARRGGRFLLQGYDNLLGKPESSARRVLKFVGKGSVEEFRKVLLLPAVQPSRRSYASNVLSGKEIQAFDRFCHMVESAQPFSRNDLLLFNEVNRDLRDRYPDVRGARGLRMGSRRAKEAAAK